MLNFHRKRHEHFRCQFHSLYSFALIKGTPGYKNMLIFIDSQRLVKTNGATFIFIDKLGIKF